METIISTLEKILDDLKEVGGVEFCAIISKQGLLMVSKEATAGLDSEAFAALTATLFMSADSTTMRLCSQRPRSIIIDTEDKQLLIYAAANEVLIVVLVGHGGYVGLILHEVKKAAKKVGNIF